MMNKNGDKYVVHEGRNPGIYDSWKETKDQVEGYPGNSYEKIGSDGNPEAKYYVVYKGAKSGVFDNWKEVHKQVCWFPGAQYNRARSFDDAAQKWDDYKSRPREAHVDGDPKDGGHKVVVDDHYDDGYYGYDDGYYGYDDESDECGYDDDDDDDDDDDGCDGYYDSDDD